jgi:hypothetical protein
MAHEPVPHQGIDPPIEPPRQVQLLRRSLPKLPVIPSHGWIADDSRRALEAVSDRDLSPAEMAAVFAETPRPQHRDECAGQPRPCPWVSCRHHLFLDVHPTSGSIRLNHGGRELEDMRQTCALDVAESGTSSLFEVAEHLGISHERVRQIEVAALQEVAVAEAKRRAREARMGTDGRSEPR